MASKKRTHRPSARKKYDCRSDAARAARGRPRISGLSLASAEVEALDMLKALETRAQLRTRSAVVGRLLIEEIARVCPCPRPVTMHRAECPMARFAKAAP